MATQADTTDNESRMRVKSDCVSGAQSLWDPRISTNRLQTGYNSLVVYYNRVQLQKM